MDLSLKTTPVFDMLWKDQKRINLLRGGSRSGKSYSLTQMVMLWLWTGYIGKNEILEGSFYIVRETFPALRASVLKEFEGLLHQHGLYPYIKHMKSTHDFYYQGRHVTFFSTDDAHKLRGRQNTFFWINEADAVSFESFNQLLMRCEKFCFLDYNPSNSNSWIKLELEDKRMIEKKDITLNVSTYKMNEANLPPAMVDEIKNLKDTDYELWKVYTLGEWVKLTGLIYKDYAQNKELPDEYSYRGFGLDFGYNDPTALVECRISKDNLYIKEHLFGRELGISEISEALHNCTNHGDTIWCDSSNPLLIKELKKRGHSTRAVKKGPDSIIAGINKIRAYNIHVTEDSLNVIKELSRYKWIAKSDKEKDQDTSDLKDKPIDKYNHSLDALRYSLERSNKGGIRLF